MKYPFRMTAMKRLRKMRVMKVWKLAKNAPLRAMDPQPTGS